MNTATTPKKNDYELIQRFFDFELEGEELAAVEQRMQTDADFLERMHLYQRMEKQVEGIGVQQTDEQFVAKTVKLEPRKTRLFQFNTLRAAAAMLILAIGCLFVFWIFSNDMGSSALAENYWNERTRSTSSITKSSEELTESEETLLEASKLFEANDMQGTLETLSNIPTTDPLFPKAALLKGETYFEQKNYKLAIEQFQIVRNAPNGGYMDLAAWYQALAYVKNSQPTEAKSNLNFIIEQQYPLQEKAEKLLEKLEK